MPKTKSKSPDLAALLASGAVARGTDEKFVLQRIPWGLEELDKVTGGGVPRNRITILTGAFSSGKSFLLQLLAKRALDTELQAAYLDTERSYDPRWWGAVGIDTERLIVSQPSSGEEAVDTACQMAEAGIDVIAIDSLAGLIPTEILESQAGQHFIASQARLINRLLQRLIGIKHNSAIICTNQQRSSLGPSPLDIMPGGWGQTFFAHLILRVQREGWLEEGSPPQRVGFGMKVICRKSKVGTPWGECTLPFLFRGDIDVISMLLDRAVEADLIHQTGPWYSIMQGEKVLGRNTVCEILRTDDAMRERLEAALGDRR